MHPRTVIRLAMVAALLAKLALAALTSGTNDTDAFYNFGRIIWEHGLLAQYRATAEFNHTPAMGWFCAIAYGLGHGAGFNFLLRLPGILADFAVVGALLRWREETGDPPWWALALLALSPVNLMVSGFHGNLDGVLVLLLLCAGLECRAMRPVWCGLWCGLAGNVKIIALLAAPVFFFHWFWRHRARSFLVTASSVMLAGWSLPLLAIPALFLGDVFGYSSNWGSWGVTYWLGQTGFAEFAPTGFSGLNPRQLQIMSALKAIIVATALSIAWRRRRLAAEHVFSTLAVVWTAFFVFAPGVGAQYLVWIGPFLLVYSPRWFAAVTAASSVFLFIFYDTICGGLPWYRGISTAELVARWAAWSNVPWVVFGALLVISLRRGSPPQSHSLSSVSSASSSSASLPSSSGSS